MCNLAIVQDKRFVGGASTLDVCHHRCYNFLIATILLWAAISISIAISIPIRVAAGCIGIEGRKEICTVVRCYAAGQFFLLLAAAPYLQRSTHLLQTQQFIGAHAASYPTTAATFSLFAQFLFALATLLLFIAGAFLHKIEHLYLFVCVGP